MTNLKKVRESKGMSQSSLSEKSGVNLRTLQMFEQGNRDINKAQVMTVIALAEALGCEIYDIVE